MAAVEKEAVSGQLPAQEADVAVTEVLYLKLWHLEEKGGKEAASTKGTSRGRQIESGTAGMRYIDRHAAGGCHSRKKNRKELRDISKRMLVHASTDHLFTCMTADIS